MIAIGVLAAFWVMQRRAPKYGLDKDKGFNLGVCCALCGILGAKLLYIIVELPAFIANPALWKNVGEGFVAVSYTHLDVYKRQPESSTMGLIT